MNKNGDIEFAIVGNEQQNELNIYTGGRNEHIISGHRAGPFILDFYALEYCTQGAFTVSINDIPFEIQKGTLYLVPPHAKYEKHYHGEISSDSYIGVKGPAIKRYLKTLGFSEDNIIFPYELSESCAEFLEKTIDSLEVRESLVITDLIKTPVVEFIRNENWSNHLRYEAPLKQSGYFSLFLSELMNIRGSNCEYASEKSIQQEYIDSAIHYINTNYHHAINIDGIAGHIGIDRSYLFRLFREEFGMSPREYLIKVRMKAACELLRLPDAQIKTVAASVGYEPINFSRIFKKTIGITPQEYRNKYMK